jgi:hypothetical protein
LRFVGAPQASTSRPASMQTIKRKYLDILIPLFAGWKSAQIIHLVTCFTISYFVVWPFWLRLYLLGQRLPTLPRR